VNRSACDGANSKAVSRRPVPGALASSGRDVWVADLTRPLLSALIDSTGSLTREWDHPRRIGRPAVATLSAHPGGCYAAGAGGVLHCDREGRLRKLTDTDAEDGALSGDTFAAVERQPQGLQPAAVQLIRPDGTVTRHHVDGSVRGLVGTDNGFVILAVRDAEHDGYVQPEHCLVRLSTAGELTMGEPFARDNRTRRFRLVSHEWLYDARPSGARQSPEFHRITAEMGIEDGQPAPEIVSLGGTNGFWFSPSCVYAVTWRPRVIDSGPGSTAITSNGSVCVLAEFAALDLSFSASVDLRWMPDHVAAAGDGTVWASGLDASDAANPTRPLLHWTPGHRSQAASIESASIFPRQTRLSVEPPADIARLDEWAEKRRDEIADAFRGAAWTFEPLRVYLWGEFPETHVVCTFRPGGYPDLVGAIAIPLYTLDGDTCQPPGQFADIEIMKKIEIGGLERLLHQAPDADGLVWLQPPRRPLGFETSDDQNVA
jgi:hypothetical protein